MMLMAFLTALAVGYERKAHPARTDSGTDKQNDLTSKLSST
jgi:hypothetical protein